MLDGFHPSVASWFAGKFGTPTEPQLLGWPRIQKGEDTLIAAPTGSGKTLAAFLACLDAMIREGALLRDETQVLYVSPLKALANDVQKNLLEPLAELRKLDGVPEIRAAVRTGDTPQSERQAMLKSPPHVLVTTPESFYLLLTSASGRKLLSTVRTVVVDEIHAVARDKRGAHLMLSLERLDALCGRRCVRVGLSATQRPIEEIGRFLTGGKACAIVESGARRELDVRIEVPRDELCAVASKEQRAEIHERIAQLVREHRTTLVFTNTRRQVERVAHALGQLLGEDQVVAHHGSLARPVRLAAEEKLKRGQVRCAVATASLELGIDVGAVDLVVQLESPRSFSVAIQRIGRASHHRGGVPKGRLFPVTRDQLVESAALVRGMRAGNLEVTRIPEWPRDVLAQQLVAMAACEDLPEDAAYALVTRAWNYRNLPRFEFDQIIEMHAEGVARRAGRALGARLHRDGVNKILKSRRGSRLAAITSGGAIPETAQYAVVAEPEGVTIGQVDEDWAVESMAGDIFLLGNESWRIRRIEAGRVRVENAHGAPPSVPFWNGEAPGRTAELSEEVSRLREEIEPLLDEPARAAAFLVEHCGLPPEGAEQIVRYLCAAKAALGALPTQRTLVAERFFDEAGGMQLIVHAPFGARQNRAFGLALRKRFCRTFDFELQAAATDEGILLSLGPQNSFPLETIFDFLSPGSIDELLTQAALLAPMWGVRWRWNATRSLAVLRSRAGKKVPFNILRMRTDDLLAQVFPAQAQCQENATGPIEPPDHPLVRETLRDCLTEAMDIESLRALLTRMHDGEIRMLARDTPEPSPLSHEILNSAPYAYLDDAPLEERRSRAVQMRRSLDPRDAASLGALDAQAIAAVVEQAFPDVRTADELHDVLLTLAWLPMAEVPARWQTWLEELRAAGRASCSDGAFRAAERADAQLVDAVRGWIGITGPITSGELAKKLGAASVEAELALLENDGLVLRGRYREGASETEWCERTLLSRIHSLTLGRLRREIEPATTQDFLRYLFRWQHVKPGSQLHGAHGLSEVLAQLQGFQSAAASWESDILPARVARYDRALLDQLCMSGEIAWGRLACPEERASPATGGAQMRAAPGDEVPRRTPPGRATPLSLLRREDLEWLLEATRGAPEPLGERARLLLALLEQRGALFVHELGAQTGLPKRELHEALWELVSGGRVTCDGFAALRALLDGKAPGASGRWSLLRPVEAEVPAPRALLGAPPAWLENLSKQYLRRYGIVFRDLLQREPRSPPWRDLLQIYRKLEARGELRGGRFAQAFSGEQFALPEAVDALRSVRKIPKQGEERVSLSACDPLNLVGILTPGARVPAFPQNRVVYVDGVPEDLTGARAAS